MHKETDREPRRIFVCNAYCIVLSVLQDWIDDRQCRKRSLTSDSQYHAQGGAQVISVTVFRRVRVVDGTKDAARSAGCTLMPGELRFVLLVNVLRRVSRSVSVTAPFLAGVSGGPASALSLDVLNVLRRPGSKCCCKPLSALTLTVDGRENTALA